MHRLCAAAPTMTFFAPVPSKSPCSCASASPVLSRVFSCHCPPARSEHVRSSPHPNVSQPCSEQGVFLPCPFAHSEYVRSSPHPNVSQPFPQQSPLLAPALLPHSEYVRSSPHHCIPQPCPEQKPLAPLLLPSCPIQSMCAAAPSTTALSWRALLSGGTMCLTGWRSASTRGQAGLKGGRRRACKGGFAEERAGLH